MLPAAEPIPTRYRNDRATCEALLAESRGDLAAASERWADAAQRWSMYGSVLELAHARFGRGRCLAALGERDAALEELREARERFGSLGAGPLVAEVDRAIAGLRR
jgi:tetratricopeptide (TPR) repeat protein